MTMHDLGHPGVYPDSYRRTRAADAAKDAREAVNARLESGARSFGRFGDIIVDASALRWHASYAGCLFERLPHWVEIRQRPLAFIPAYRLAAYIETGVVVIEDRNAVRLSFEWEEIAPKPANCE